MSENFSWNFKSLLVSIFIILTFNLIKKKNSRINLCQAPFPKLVANFSFASFEVHLGALNFNDESEEGRVIVTSDQAILHENYNGIVINNDIAIIRLPEAVSGPSIFTNCLLLSAIILRVFVSCRYCAHSAALVVHGRRDVRQQNGQGQRLGQILRQWVSLKWVGWIRYIFSPIMQPAKAARQAGCLNYFPSGIEKIRPAFVCGPEAHNI